MAISQPRRQLTPDDHTVVITHLLWCLVVSDLLVELTGQRCFVLEYADDILIIVRGMFLGVPKDLYYLSLWILSAGEQDFC